MLHYISSQDIMSCLEDISHVSKTVRLWTALTCVLFVATDYITYSSTQTLLIGSTQRQTMAASASRANIIFIAVVVVFIVLGYLIYSEFNRAKYSEWSSWSACSKSCGEGLRNRSRQCTSLGVVVSKDCQGPSHMTEKCKADSGLPCPTDGGFEGWSGYWKCSVTCGGGVQVRVRRCIDPMPEYGGKRCQGSYYEFKDCNAQPCPIDGKYSAWGQFSQCEIPGNTNCGKGKKVRARTCNNPVPQHGGKPCQGSDKETAECEIPCPTTAHTTSTNSSARPAKP